MNTDDDYVLYALFGTVHCADSMRLFIYIIKFSGDAFLLYLAGNSKGGNQLKIFQELSALLPGISIHIYLVKQSNNRN